MTTIPRINCVLFSKPNGKSSHVTVDGAQKGDIERVEGTQWQYHGENLELSGSHMDIRRHITAHYAGQAA